MIKNILYGIVIGVGAILSIIVSIVAWIMMVFLALLPWIIKIGILASLVYLFLRLLGAV